MAVTSTPKFGLPQWGDGGDQHPQRGDWNTILAAIASGAAEVLPPAAYATRPAPGARGRLFWATDQNSLYLDDGTTWQSISMPADIAPSPLTLVRRDSNKGISAAKVSGLSEPDSADAATTKTYVDRHTQVGTIVISEDIGSALHQRTIVFPVPFKTLPIVVVSLGDNNGNNTPLIVFSTAVSTTQADMCMRYINGYAGITTTRLNWVAVGG